MPNTVENQRIIRIHREKVNANFLQIKKENWYAANKDLSPYGLQVYLYLAGNMDGYNLALSSADAENNAGIKHSTFYKYFDLLVEKGYLVQKKEGSNIYDFYEVPKGKEVNADPPCGKGIPSCGSKNPSDGNGSPSYRNEIPHDKPLSSSRNREIYNNTDVKYKIDNNNSESFIF